MFPSFYLLGGLMAAIGFFLGLPGPKPGRWLRALAGALMGAGVAPGWALGWLIATRGHGPWEAEYLLLGALWGAPLVLGALLSLAAEGRR